MPVHPAFTPLKRTDWISTPLAADIIPGYGHVVKSVLVLFPKLIWYHGGYGIYSYHYQRPPNQGIHLCRKPVWKHLPMSLKVSLIVPAYNEAKFIGKMLTSLQSQTYKSVEIIVVDNASTDSTAAIAAQFTPHVVREDTKGYGFAVNRGSAMATGDLIAFCDADSLYPPNWVADMVIVFRDHPEAVAVYGSAITHDAGWFMNKINGIIYTQFLVISRRLGLDNTSGFNFMIQKSAFDRVGGYDVAYQKMSPDIMLGKKLHQIGAIIFAPKIRIAASFRRFTNGGIIATAWMFLTNWWAVVRGKSVQVAYTDYNKEYR